MLSFRQLVGVVMAVDLTRGAFLLAVVGVLTLAGVAVDWPGWLSCWQIGPGFVTHEYDMDDIGVVRNEIQGELYDLREVAVAFDAEHESNEKEMVAMEDKRGPLKKRIEKYRDFLASSQQEYLAKGQIYSREEVKEKLVLRMADLKRLDRHITDKREFNRGLERDITDLRAEVTDKKLIAADLRDREVQVRADSYSLSRCSALAGRQYDTRDYEAFIKEVDKQRTVKRKLRSFYVSADRIPLDYSDEELLAECDDLLGD